MSKCGSDFCRFWICSEFTRVSLRIRDSKIFKLLRGLISLTLVLLMSSDRRFFYAVADRTPRDFPWLNEPGGGIMSEWKLSKQHIAYIDYNTMLCGYAEAAAKYTHTDHSGYYD